VHWGRAVGWHWDHVTGGVGGCRLSCVMHPALRWRVPCLRLCLAARRGLGGVALAALRPGATRALSGAPGGFRAHCHCFWIMCCCWTMSGHVCCAVRRALRIGCACVVLGVCRPAAVCTPGAGRPAGPASCVLGCVQQHWCALGWGEPRRSTTYPVRGGGSPHVCMQAPCMPQCHPLINHER
jgi:hypothetical protein